MNQVSRRAFQSAIQLDSEFAAAVIDGLLQDPKTLPCRYFYDARGSALFEEITRLPEYYPARTEVGILRRHASEMAASVRSGAVLVEFGSGSSRKTEILLEALPALAAYVPIDVSDSALGEAAHRLHSRFPFLRVRPVVGNFSDPVEYPADIENCEKLGFFPGSTIGNMNETDAVHLLGQMRRSLSGGRLIVGIDLRKDPKVLVPAYDDAAGVTAAFNLNLLVRINRELGGSFGVSAFTHRAVYNQAEGRVEMHLVSERAQTVRILGHAFKFARGETIHTENSYKYSVEGFRALSRLAGWTPQRVWLDDNWLFSVHELVD
jgi:dimethylhistidine N-methyltransferase